MYEPYCEKKVCPECKHKYTCMTSGDQIYCITKKKGINLPYNPLPGINWLQFDPIMGWQLFGKRAARKMINKIKKRAMTDEKLKEFIETKVEIL